MQFESFPNFCCKFGKRRFWRTGYVVSTVGVNEATIIKHVREQKEWDEIIDQCGLIKRPSARLRAAENNAAARAETEPSSEGS